MKNKDKKKKNSTKKNVTGNTTRKKAKTVRCSAKNEKKIGKNVQNVRSKKKKTDKSYSVESMKEAIKAVSAGTSIRKAADAFEVSPTTLHRQHKSPDKTNWKSGPATYLSEEEENDIVLWVIYRAERGSPVTKTELLDCVQNYITSLGKKTPFKNNRPGRHWFEAFRRRHPNLTSRVAQHLTVARASVTEEDLRKWFAEIKRYLESKNLLDIDPSRVFNCDETNIEFCPKDGKVLAEKGAATVYKVVGNDKESCTVLFMYSANGTRAPPMILFTFKEKLPKKLIENVPKGWGIGLAENGWMTIETFYEYIVNIFYPWCLKNNIEFPVIIYLDGHSSHVTVPLVKFCREKGIELILLYPNATHIYQPLDTNFFRVLKEIWATIVSQWKMQNNILRLRIEQFPAVLKIALDSFTQEQTIMKNAFKTCGLLPLNPDALQYNMLKKKKKGKTSNLSEYQVSTENQQLVSSSENKDQGDFLIAFENTLPAQLLEAFKNDKSSKVWTGSIEQTGLFQYWLDMSLGTKAADGSIFTK